jgi:ribosomal-protein-serine acetyltransferase
MFKHDLGEGADLRFLEMRHAAELLAFVEMNRAHLDEYLGWTHGMRQGEDAEKFIKRGITRYGEDGLPYVGIWQDGVMAGGILFFPLEARIGATEIGYWLGREFTGRGLMSRAVLAMLSYCFDALKLNRVALGADVGNAPSRALAERLGFVYEGTQRNAWIHNGQRVDIAFYAMLATDWEAALRPLIVW